MFQNIAGAKVSAPFSPEPTRFRKYVDYASLVKFRLRVVLAEHFLGLELALTQQAGHLAC